METQQDEAPLVQARGIGRRLPGRDGWLFRQLSLAIEPGARIALVGSTGAGKTVLLNALAMLIGLDEGQVAWRGGAVRGRCVPRFRADVVYLHQSPVLFSGTVEENLRQPFQLRVHREKRFDRDRLRQWMSAAGRSDSLWKQPAPSLSGGERQIVALLRAVQLDPSVLLLDEPTASLDVGSARAIEDLVTRWQAARPQQRAYLWVSHAPDQVARVADRVFGLEGGKLVEESPRHG
jgi:putative ABC transport system ATP-binding protein